MKDLKTSGVQPFMFSEPSPYILLESVHDTLKYFDYDIIMKGEHAFLNRQEISIDNKSDLTPEKKQYYANGLLITGLLEQLSNEEYFKIEQQFEKLLETISNLIQRKLEAQKLNSCHCVFIHKDDHGNIVIGFIKKDVWKEYNDETGYLKLCS